MPNGPNCMSFLYRRLVFPDFAPPTCKSNNFLICGGTVTYSCRRAHTPRSLSDCQKFASSSILARSAANCRLPRANSRAEFDLVAPFLRRHATSAQNDRTDRKIPQIVVEKSGGRVRPLASTRAPKLFEAENFHWQDARRRTRRQKRCSDADEERCRRDPYRVQRIRVERHVRDCVHLGVQRNQSPLIRDPGKRITD